MSRCGNHLLDSGRAGQRGDVYIRHICNQAAKNEI